MTDTWQAVGKATLDQLTRYVNGEPANLIPILHVAFDVAVQAEVYFQKTGNHGTAAQKAHLKQAQRILQGVYADFEDDNKVRKV